MKPAAELRQGSTYRKDNIPYLILKAERHQSTSGKRQRAAEVKFKTKELISGKIQEITVLATELMDDIILDRNQMQFLYEIDGEYNFMDQETFEQITLSTEDLGDAGRILLRPSGTEPKIRVMAEGSDEARLHAIVEELAAVISRED